MNNIKSMFHTQIGQPKTLESMIPIWGSGRSAIDYFQQNKHIRGSFQSVMCVSEIFLVKSLVVGGVKLASGSAIKLNGSHTWNATRSWINPESGKHLHHWLFKQNMGIGKHIPNFIKNQPFNIIILNAKTHMKIHSNSHYITKLIYTTPHWIKNASLFAINKTKTKTIHKMNKSRCKTYY